MILSTILSAAMYPSCIGLTSINKENSQRTRKRTEINVFLHELVEPSSAAPTRCTAGVAFEAGAVADQGEVTACLAAVALVALNAGSADALEADFVGVVFFRQWRNGEGAVEFGRRS